ncbi:non-homologous end joining protein Ku [Brevibacterium luteolum]|uniref:Non-homologous end joining protein Ku n=1 Tax=Brevibacterium luteolum TaxID=199591 RepID=A0A849AWJ3_9MICO|nr:Ku protein [Brevibacterium luteolum]MBM7529027.1 DNA end-binding protein Ku [Brevibacterium luteolum]MCT1658278.1 Ku protein [Brevibacterium luteolum]MCT1830342.1 Ku protein [Brevibacterium luteolum]NNG80172.1 Ku protein [Brevibacterium luteolum]
MRAIWTGAITFGLVNVPVKAYSATENHDVSFHQVHDADGGRIRYERRCEVCGEKVEYKDIDKAYESGDDTVIVTDDDFEALPESDNDEIEVVQFVPTEQIDPIMLDRTYYLEPAAKSPKSYLLLRQALEDSDRTAVVTYSLRQKTRLGVLRVRGKVLVLQGMLWADEVRSVDFKGVKSKAKISSKEKELAGALVEQFASDFTPEEFEDDYQVELRKLIDAKLEAGDTLDTEATFGETPDEAGEADGDDADVVDLMEALKSSLDRRRDGSKQKSGGSSSGKKAGGKKSDEKKSGGKKSSKKKSDSAKSA